MPTHNHGTTTNLCMVAFTFCVVHKCVHIRLTFLTIRMHARQRRAYGSLIPLFAYTGRNHSTTVGRTITSQYQCYTWFYLLHTSIYNLICILLSPFLQVARYSSVACYSGSAPSGLPAVTSEADCLAQCLSAYNADPAGLAGYYCGYDPTSCNLAPADLGTCEPVASGGAEIYTFSACNTAPPVTTSGQGNWHATSLKLSLVCLFVRMNAELCRLRACLLLNVYFT